MAIYYCWSGATGANTGLTQADAWTNLQSFLTIKGNDDICYLRGTQTLAASLTDVIALPNTNPAFLIGVDAAWAETGERAIIDGNSTAVFCIDFSGGGTNLVIKNVELTNPTGVQIYFGTGCSLINCKLSNSPLYAITRLTYSHIFQTNFSSNLTDLRDVNQNTLSACIATGGGQFAYTSGAGSINSSIIHDYTSQMFYSCSSITINNTIMDDADIGVDMTNVVNVLVSNCRLTNMVTAAIQVVTTFTGIAYYNSYFYNPASSDIIGASLAALLDMGYNRLTPANSGTGYANLPANDFTLDPITDPSVGLAVPVGWVNEAVNIAYLTAGIPPEFPSPSTPTSLGITRFEPLTNGKFYVEWDAGTGTITSYNIYLRAGSAPSFTAAYCAKKICYVLGLNYTILSLESDQETLLGHGTDYYCSVRAANGTSEDANTAVLNNLCSGAEGIQRQINTNYTIR